MSDILADYRARDKAWQGTWKKRLEDTGRLFGDDLQCPHCGHVQEDLTDYGYLIDSHEGEMECASCGEPFDVEVYVSYMWTCTKKEG